MKLNRELVWEIV